MIGEDLNLKLAEWRNKAREGTLTKEEMREAILAMRTARGKTGAVTGGSKVTKAKKAAAGKPDGDELLSELEGL